MKRRTYVNITASTLVPLMMGLQACTVKFNASVKTTDTSTTSTSTTSTSSGGTSSDTPTSAPSSLSYGEYKIYIANSSVVSVTPATTGGDPTSYSVSPALPAGLSLDATTGVLSGTPTATSAATDYVFTGSNALGSTDVTLSIRVATGYIVNDTGDADDADAGANGTCATAGGVCTLRAAITELNNTPGTLTTILIPENMTITLGAGGVLPITKDLEIVGESRSTTIIDGDGHSGASPSSLFVVQNSAISIVFERFTIQYVNSTAGPALSEGFNTNNIYYIKNMSFLHNTSSAESGAIGLNAPDTVSVTDSEFRFNTASGGVGGAMSFNPSVSATIERSLFEGNTASGGASAVISYNSISITNTTFYNNDGAGVALYVNSGTLTLLNCTFADNDSTNAFTVGAFAADATVKNTIVINNTGPSGACKNNGGAITSSGGNLVYPADVNCNFIHGSDIASGDPALGSLQDNGGKTETLLPTSLVIDTGVLAGCPALDQRGYTRPAGAGCDAGAVEIQ